MRCSGSAQAHALSCCRTAITLLPANANILSTGLDAADVASPAGGAAPLPLLLLLPSPQLPLLLLSLLLLSADSAVSSHLLAVPRFAPGAQRRS